MHEIDINLKSKNNPQSALISDNTVITIVIPWAEAHQAYQRALQRAGAKFKTDGFRRGKLPLAVVEQQAGRAYLIQEAINIVLPEKYAEAVKASGKKVIAYPEFVPLSLEWEKDWKLEAHTAEEPDFKLGDYKKVIKKAQEEAAKEIAKIEKETAKTAEKSTKTKDAAETKETKDSKEAKTKDGKKTEAAPKLPAMSDEAKNDKKLETIIKALVTTIKPAIPEILVKQQAHNELHQLEGQLKNIGMSLNDYLTRRGVTETVLLQELATASLAQLQTDFIMIKLTQAEKLEVTDAEIDAQLGGEAKGKAKNDQASAQLRSMIRTSMQRQKLAQFLLA